MSRKRTKFFQPFLIIFSNRVLLKPVREIVITPGKELHRGTPKIPSGGSLIGEEKMKNWQVLLASAFFLLAIIIFVFASGARRIYSGLFFTILGIVIIVTNVWRPKNKG